jgi:hypothetical protein
VGQKHELPPTEVGQLEAKPCRGGMRPLVAFPETGAPSTFLTSEKTPRPPLGQNLVKPPRQRFLHYVVDSLGEINVANVALLPFAA